MKSLPYNVVFVAVTLLGCTTTTNTQSGQLVVGAPVMLVPVQTQAIAQVNGGGTVTQNDTGCADQTREGFRDVARFQRVAGCAGAWSVPGLHASPPGGPNGCPGVRTYDTRVPHCGRRAGNSLRDPYGQGCSAADLCADGWHVCEGAVELTAVVPDGCAGAVNAGDPPVIFLTRQSSNGCGVCALGQRMDADCDALQCTASCLPTSRIANDLFGCGNFGQLIETSCGPLNRSTTNLCSALAGSPWRCDAAGPEDDNGLCEAYTIVKESPTHGGVLCCRD